MKKICLFLIVICFMFSFALIANKVKATETNLVANSSFDSALASHYEDNHDDYQVSSVGKWTTWFNGYKDDTNGVGGSSCLGLTVCWAGLAGNVWSTAWQDVTVEANQTYTLTFQAKEWGTTPYTGLHVQGRNLGDVNSWDGDVFDKAFALTEDYATYTITFNVAERTTFRLAFWVYTVENTETSGVKGVFVDDVKLVKTSETSNLLGNKASLEGGAIANDYINAKVYNYWSTLDSSYVLWEPANAFNGNMVANLMYRVEDTTVTPWPLLYTDMAVEKNSTYTLTFYARNWRADLYSDQVMFIGYRNMASEAIWDQVQGMAITPTADYCKYTFTFTTGELEDIRLVLFCQAQNRLVDDTIGGGIHLEVESLVKSNNIIGDSFVEKAIVSHFDDNGDNYQVSSADHWTSWWYGSKDAAGFNDASAIKLDYAWTEFVNVKDVWSTVWTDVTLTPNTNYKLTFKANNYTAGADCSSYFRGLFVQGRTLGEVNSWDPDLFEKIFTSMPEGYNEYSVVFNSENFSSLRLTFFVLTADPDVTRSVGLVLLDNIFLEPTEESVTVEQKDVVTITLGDVNFGEDYAPVVTSKFGEAEVKYYADNNGEKGALLDAKPTAAGIYHAEATSKNAVNFVADTKEVKFEIKKASQVVEVVCASSVYGEALNPIGSSSFAEAEISYVYYADNDGSVGEQLREAPVNCGTYYVKAIAKGNEAFLDGESAAVKFTIRKANNEWVTIPSVADITEGEVLAPMAEAKYGKVTFTYSDSEDGEFAVKRPTKPGTYYMKATFEGADNYQELSTIVSFKINEKAGGSSSGGCGTATSVIVSLFSAFAVIGVLLRKKH